VSKGPWRILLPDVGPPTTVVFVDRWASHRHNPEVEVWYKMSIRIFDHPPPPGFFESARQNLLETYEIAEPPPHKKLPRVTYIDRQDTSRRMSDETHVRFLQVLETMQDEQKIEFRHMRLEKYPPVVQVDYVAWSDVSRRVLLGHVPSPVCKRHSPFSSGPAGCND